MNQSLGGLPAHRLALLLGFALPASLLGGAYISQYVFGLNPCEMCWWQRYPHFAALGFAGLAFLLPQRHRALIWLAAIAILISGLIGGFHAGVEYGWWEGVTSCATSMDENVDALDAIMSAPLVRCDVAPWDLFGISLAGWNFLISSAGALAILRLLAQKRHP